MARLLSPGTEYVACLTQRILALTGPSGAGKTAVLRALSRPDALRFDVVEWQQHASFHDSGDRMSAVERFAAFLQAAATYPRLALKTHGGAMPHAGARRIILVEDWPNLFHPETRDRVHAALQQFVVGVGAPLVLVISDSVPRLDADTPWDDQPQARRAAHMDVRMAVPPSVRSHPAFAEIRFNPLTARMIHGALMRRDPTASHARLADVAAASDGDIRSAMMQAALPGTADTSGRTSAMIVFHAIGRVLYNKRVGDPDSADKGDPSAQHTAQEYVARRPWRTPYRPSLVDMEHMWAHIPVDASTFALYLHHNLLGFVNEVDEAMHALEALSIADALTASEPGPASAPYLFHTSVRGVLDALPSPVTRRGQTLTKPAYWASRQRQDTCEAIVDSVRQAASPTHAPGLARCGAAAWATEIAPLISRWRPDAAWAPYLTWANATHDDTPQDDMDVVPPGEPAQAPAPPSPSQDAVGPARSGRVSAVWQGPATALQSGAALHTCEGACPEEGDGGLSDELEDLGTSLLRSPRGRAEHRPDPR